MLLLMTGNKLASGRVARLYRARHMLNRLRMVGNSMASDLSFFVDEPALAEQTKKADMALQSGMSHRQRPWQRCS